MATINVFRDSPFWLPQVSGKRAAQGEVFLLSSELERKASRTASACDLIFAGSHVLHAEQVRLRFAALCVNFFHAPNTVPHFLSRASGQ